MHALSFIWHQFRSDTRHHFWFLVGYGGLIALLAWVNTTSSFDYVVDERGIPRTEYQIMVILITLLPASFMVPFLVFADPVDAPDAFWRVKPMDSLSMAAAKVLWAVVWLLGMPLFGECISVILLGGVSKLPYIAIDFIGLRAMVLFLVFALATWTNQPFKFLIGFVVLLFSFFVIGSLMSSHIAGPPLAYRAGITKTISMFGFIIMASLLMAFVQYRWRLPMIIGFPLVVCFYVIGFILKIPTIDVFPSLPVSSDPQFQQLKMDMSEVKVHQGKRTLDGNDSDVLQMTFTLDNIPPMSAVGFGEMDLNVNTSQTVHTFSHLPAYAFSQLRMSRLEVNRDFSNGNQVNDRQQAQRKGVYLNILRQLSGQKMAESAPLINEFAIPIPKEPGVEEPVTWKINGLVRYHCFSYFEFGRFPIDTEKVNRHISMNKSVGFDFNKNEVSFRWLWKAGYSRYPGIRVTIREVSSWIDPMNLDSLTFGSPIPSHWFFYFYNSAKDEYWENPDHVNYLHAHGVPWSPLYFGFSPLKGPEDFTYDEWIACRARFSGCIEIPFETEILKTP